jgi:hypothetical protein
MRAVDVVCADGLVVSGCGSGCDVGGCLLLEMVGWLLIAFGWGLR